MIPRKKWSKEGSDPIKEGDIVLILDDQLPRNQWRKGFVTEIIPDRDKQVRKAVVRTAISTFATDEKTRQICSGTRLVFFWVGEMLQTSFNYYLLLL